MRDDDLLPLLLAARLRRMRGGTPRHTVRAAVLILLFLLAAAVAGAVVAGARAVQVALTDCSLAGRAARPLPVTSTVYAANGYLLGTIPAPLHRRPVSFQRMSPWVRKATIAAEDRTFWKNDGLDYASIARAALADLSAGRAVQGASTITQQLVRNLYLDDDKSLARKQLEACLALELTKQRTKHWILASYLNRIPYGHHALGIEAAARTYYGIPASRLGPDQAAFLAGLPQAPSSYDPFLHRLAALARRNEVLRALVGTHALERSQYRRLRKRGLGLRPGHGYGVQRMPDFFHYVEQQLVAVYGQQEVEDGGLRVRTTLDPRAERLALEAMRGTLYRRGDPAAAVVSIDPQTGAIRTLASAWRGHNLQFDLPTSAARQTGSAFKPFVLTDAVWLHHADPNTTWYDSSRFTYRGWTPQTYEGRYFGPETLTKATLLSDNVVYAKLTLDVGPESVALLAHRMGITSPLQAVPSIGLGSNSVTPLVLASAYTTLADGGYHHPPYAIAKVVLPDGTVDKSHGWGPQPGFQAVPLGVAWTVTKVLEENVQSGTGTAARIPGRHVAGKTGTTTNWTDAWFAGYTPRLTTVTWVGYPLSERRSMSNVHGIQVQGATFPAQIWHEYMVGALGHIRPLDFPRGKWLLEPYHGPRSMSGR